MRTAFSSLIIPFVAFCPLVSGVRALTVQSVSISPTSASIQVGSSQQFTATAHFSNGTTSDVTSAGTWTSSRTSVATVSAGLAHAVAVGSSTIKVTYSGKSASATLTVTAVTCSTHNVDLSWTETDSGVTFNLYRGTASGGPYSQIQTGITGLNAVDNAVIGGATYYYVVTAFNGQESSYSAPASAVVPCSSGGGGGTSYFGAVDSSGNPLSGSANQDLLSGYAVNVDITSAASYNTCPGSGSKQLVSLGVYAFVGSGSGNVRLAIYGPVDGTHNNTLIAQGSSFVSLSNTSRLWVENTSFIDASGAPITPTLNGGSVYQIVATADSGSSVDFDYGVNGAHNKWATGSDVGGFPNPLNLPNDEGTEMPTLRAGVQ